MKNHITPKYLKNIYNRTQNPRAPWQYVALGVFFLLAPLLGIIK